MGSNCRTIQTKFHLENKSSPRNYLNVVLKMFKLCNLKYHLCLSVIVSMRNLEKTQSPESPINRPWTAYACTEVHLTGPEVRN
jgi:hypothetical protein